MKKLALILFALVLVSCKIDADKIINTNESLKVSIYGTGINIDEYWLNPGEEKYNQFIS